jgi:hypothetical protein
MRMFWLASMSRVWGARWVDGKCIIIEAFLVSQSAGQVEVELCGDGPDDQAASLNEHEVGRESDDEVEQTSEQGGTPADTRTKSKWVMIPHSSIVSPQIRVQNAMLGSQQRAAIDLNTGLSAIEKG